MSETTPPELTRDEALFSGQLRGKCDALIQRFETLMLLYPIRTGETIPPEELAPITADTDTLREEIRQLLPQLTHPLIKAAVTEVLDMLDDIARMLASPTGF